MKARVRIVILGAVLVISFVSHDGLADVTNGLAAYYPFDGNARDLSGNNNHATVYGAAY